MKLNFIQRLLNKTIAKQLRKPGGLLAGKVGKEMNISNSFLYDFTIKTMQLQDHESILEIGFGNGKFFDKIFSIANDLEISGLDYSPEMVKAATVNNLSTSASGKLTLRLGSSDNIPFPGNSFDKIFCINVIYFWEQPAAHLKEIHRVLKPGGRFYTSVRRKESLVQMPFAKYGFKIYDQEEWITMLESSLLQFVQIEEAPEEPGAALCIVAEKKN